VALTQILLNPSIGLGSNHRDVDGRWRISSNVKLEIQQRLSSVGLDDCGLLLGSFLAKLWECFVAIELGAYGAVNWVEWIKF
jgi:hypothetical protein